MAKSNRQNQLDGKPYCRICGGLLSPTRMVIDFMKNLDDNTDLKTDRLKSWSWGLFILEVITGLVLIITKTTLSNVTHLSAIYYAFSRINEITYAFYRDGISKIAQEPAGTSLTFAERVTMAMRSYFGLIFNFAIIYYFLPYLKFQNQFESLWDAFYFSTITITTLGYGDNYPINDFAKGCVIYEVLAGIFLIVVAIGIYISSAKNTK